MLRGLSTISFYADDVMAARAWYAELLGIEPYFVRPVQGTPAYVEFRIGDRPSQGHRDVAGRPCCAQLGHPA